jgi:hypothetical protein
VMAALFAAHTANEHQAKGNPSQPSRWTQMRPAGSFGCPAAKTSCRSTMFWFGAEAIDQRGLRYWPRRSHLIQASRTMRTGARRG